MASWSLDNWLYSTYNAYRLRWTPRGTALKESTAPNNQSGASQDDYGKLCSSMAAVNWDRSVPDTDRTVLMRKINLLGLRSPGDRSPDFQGGPSRAPDGTLLTSRDVRRGHLSRDRLPAELRQLVLRRTGRASRAPRHCRGEGRRHHASNPYDAEKSEFLRSTDPLFRPLNMATAPTARSISSICIAASSRRKLTLEALPPQDDSASRHGKPIGRGDHRRLVHDDEARPAAADAQRDSRSSSRISRTRMAGGATPREAARARQDKSVVPALTTMAQSHGDHLARLHAPDAGRLGALTLELVRAKLKDAHPQLRAAAIA